MNKSYLTKVSNLVSDLSDGSLTPILNSVLSDLSEDEIFQRLNVILSSQERSLVSFKELFAKSKNKEVFWGAIAMGIRQRQMAEHPTVTPVCTGAQRMAILSTPDALKKIIKDAKKTIYIFGYWMTSNAAEIISELSLASDRGVDIIILGHSMESFFEPLLKSWSSHKHPHMYVYTDGTEPNSSFDTNKMHAKTIIVDDTKMLISSANITYRGLNENIEIGVMVEDVPSIKKVCKFMNQLIHDSVKFKKVMVPEK